jgi:hypothetical protein
VLSANSRRACRKPDLSGPTRIICDFGQSIENTIFEPIWVGLPATVAGLLFMMLKGTRLLPEDKRKAGTGAVQRLYRVELRVQPKANLDGKTLEVVGFARPVVYTLLSVRRDGAALEITPTLKLSGGDILAFTVPVGILPGLGRRSGLFPCTRARILRRVTNISWLRS